METVDLSGYRIMHMKTKSILREKRIVAGMTQREVAEKAQIVLQQYQKFESGERNIMTASFQMTCRIIEALGMNVSDFYHGKYSLGEELIETVDGLYYAKTCRSIHEDVR